jgi:hypothetical protein
MIASTLTHDQRAALAAWAGEADRRERVAERRARVAAQVAWLYAAVTPEERIWIAAEVAHLDAMAEAMGEWR